MIRYEQFWSGRPVFVTGATGLLGGWLVRALHIAGAEVTVLLRDSVPKSMFIRDGWMDRVRVVHGDIRDASLLRRVFSEYSIETILHVAAQALVGVAKADPVSTLETNVQGTWTVLDAARQSGVGQIVVASSDKAYGIPDRLPYDEEHRLHGTFPYEVSKSCADLICSMYAATYGLPVCVTRCANLFGGGDLNFSRSVPGAIRASLEGKRFQIRSNGKSVRDFLYVKDAVAAYMRTVECLAADPGLAGEAFNFSLETPMNVLALVNLIYRLTGADQLSPEVLNIADSEIPEQYLSSEKARRVLNWHPAFSMESGLLETIEWYRRFLGHPAEIMAGVAVS